MSDLLHALYDAGMNDIDIIAMISIGINRAIILAIQQDDKYLIPQLRKWASIAEEWFYKEIKRGTD